MVSAPATGEPFEIALKLGFIASEKLFRAPHSGSALLLAAA
jgi:hypothetical protein